MSLFVGASISKRNVRITRPASIDATLTDTTHNPTERRKTVGSIECGLIKNNRILDLRAAKALASRFAPGETVIFSVPKKKPRIERGFRYYLNLLVYSDFHCRSQFLDRVGFDLSYPFRRNTVDICKLMKRLFVIG